MVKSKMVSLRILEKDLAIIEDTIKKVNENPWRFKVSRSEFIANVLVSVCKGADIDSIKKLTDPFDFKLDRAKIRVLDESEMQK